MALGTSVRRAIVLASSVVVLLTACGDDTTTTNVDRIEVEILKMAETMEIPPYHLPVSDLEYVVSIARAENWGTVRPKAGRVEIFTEGKYFCLHLPRRSEDPRVLYEAPC
jgi:hypothetical protein